MKRFPFPLAIAALVTLSMPSFACDPKTEVVVDLRDEPARRIFADLAEGEGLTVTNSDMLDGRTLTANFKACSVLEAIDLLSASINLSITIDGNKLTLVTAKSTPG